jgi:hypothetical protein
MAMFLKSDFIFIHVYKCGGRSARFALSEHAAVGEVMKSHATALEVKKYMYDNGEKFYFDNAFKFSFIRNPFDWVVSLYEFIRQSPKHENYEEVKNLSFDEFTEWNVRMIHESRDNSTGKFNTLSGFLCDENGNLLVDFVGRMENYEADLKEIASRLRMPVSVVPRENASKRNADYRIYYSDKSRQFIQDQFSQDLSRFNYQF